MGFANDLILLAFGLMLGAVAVAAAIAFGLGGRKAAGQIVERWTKPKVKDSNQSEETQ
jgi:F0F1-type ATP synthase membrane subunit c/vacuolar-type H+-ATPase subunit K